MVMVRVSETYDLSTKVGKMGIVGIHTPQSDLVTRHYAGLVQNYKFARFVSCDVSLACASMLPADPLQIGVEAGSIAPQDMFNPILYRAVSNESMNALLGYLEGVGSLDAQVDKNSVVDINSTNFVDGSTQIDQFDMYYGLLSNTDGWKKAMPQAGLRMKGLFPMCFQVLANTAQPSRFGVGNAVSDVSVPTSSNDPTTIGTITSQMFRGHGMRMPRFPTLTWVNKANADVFLSGDIYNAESTLRMSRFAAYVGLIVLPPATLNQLYYRMKVTWTIEFSELRSMSEVLDWKSLANLGDASYATDYAAQSKSMTSIEGMVDTSSADIHKVMEGI